MKQTLEEKTRYYANKAKFALVSGSFIKEAKQFSQEYLDGDKAGFNSAKIAEGARIGTYIAGTALALTEYFS